VERWRASFSTHPDLAAALVDALRKVMPSERLDLVTGEEDDRRFATLALTVAATSADEAFELVQRVVARAVDLAQLNPGLVPGLGHVVLLPPVFATSPLEDQLAKEAERLAGEGQTETAVLRAQAACEVFAAKALEQMALMRGGERLFKLTKPRAFSLADGRTIAIFFLLTGEWIDEAPWWGDYERHLERRHRIVHAGGVVGADEANKSLAAASKFRRYVREAWARAWGTELHPEAS
jgi:hypothetical protein